MQGIYASKRNIAISIGASNDARSFADQLIARLNEAVLPHAFTSVKTLNQDIDNFWSIHDAIEWTSFKI